MQTVFLRSGDQPRKFPFGNSQAPVLTITTNQNSLPIYKEAIYSSFQAIVEGVGAVTATVAIQGSNDDDTGRGMIHGANNAPGLPVSVTAASPTMTSPDNAFTANMVGKLIDCPGVPVGTTVSAVAAGGASLTMSGNATVSGTRVQAIFRAQAWASTALATLTLTGNDLVTDLAQHVGSARYVRAVVTNITGVGAAVRVLMGV